MMSAISVPISTQTFLGLAEFLREKGSDRDPVEVIDSAIDYWMNNADWNRKFCLQRGSWRDSTGNHFFFRQERH